MATPTVQEQLKQREVKTQTGINDVYDSGLAAQNQALLDAYNANTEAQAKQGQSIRQNYETAKGDVGVQNDRNTANLTQFADVRGLNSGAGSQHQLSLGNARAASEGVIANKQQQALAENQRQTELMTLTYQNQVAAALADNDYKRAAALLDNYNNENKWREQQAQILASYGNFDEYGELYGSSAAKNMSKVWNAKNPNLAYRTGAITADQYRQITGKWPAGYNPPGSPGYSGDWWNYQTPDSKDDDNGLIGAPVSTYRPHAGVEKVRPVTGVATSNPTRK